MRRTPAPLLLVVVGPTASGKTDLAHEVALRRGGEIVSADAFAVYRGLDVGTAKPSPERRGRCRITCWMSRTPRDFFGGTLGS